MAKKVISESEVIDVLSKKEKIKQIEHVVSTGSTLLDLCISGEKIRGGGIPGGIIVEIYGPSGCLASDTFINYEILSQDGKRQNHKGGTIENLYYKFHRIQRGGSGNYLRGETEDSYFTTSCMNSEGFIFHNKICDVVKTGKQECFEITTKTGAKLTATGNHKFFNGNVYIKLSDLNVGDAVILKGCRGNVKKKVVRLKPVLVKHHPFGGVKIIENKYEYKRIELTRFIYEAYINKLPQKEYRARLNKGDLTNLIFLPKNIHVHHINEDRLNNEIDNLLPINRSEHGKIHSIIGAEKSKHTIVGDEIISISAVGMRNTYDLKMLWPHHNYVAHDFVVHNSGKSALLVEIAGSAQRNGGEARFDDPEARLDKEYSKIYGFEMQKENYHRPDTVKEMFKGLWGWEPKDNTKINVSCEDSLAALSTEMEMEEEDKMGMKRAKDFSEGLRKTCRFIANNNWLIVCSNQERNGTNGVTTPGGQAIPYYSSLRMRIAPEFAGSKIDKTKTIGKAKLKKITGVLSKIKITKSSIDEPFRECNISIIFGYGIDDIRENLIYKKLYTDNSKFLCPDGKEFAFIDKAIEHIEENNLELALKEETINLWYEVQKMFDTNRKKKVRI